MSHYIHSDQLKCCRKSENNKPKYFPSYCRLCDHIAEMKGWRRDFVNAFQHIRIRYAKRQLLPRKDAENLLEEVGSFPSCAVPILTDDKKQLKEIDCMDALGTALKEFHLQAWIQDEVNEARNW